MTKDSATDPTRCRSLILVNVRIKPFAYLVTVAKFAEQKEADRHVWKSHPNNKQHPQLQLSWLLGIDEEPRLARCVISISGGRTSQDNDGLSPSISY
jgi:hypothetical protein